MENPLIQIKDAVVMLLKGLDPGVDVFFEEIKSTDEEHGMEEKETYYFVDVIPNINDTVDKFFTDIGILVDIAYHEKNESNTAYLIKAAELDGVIRPVFSFGNRHITVSGLSSRVTDHVLHCSFSVTFRQARMAANKFQEMGELEVAIKQGE